MIGAGIDRVDGRKKVSGGADYTGDVVLPGMLHGMLVMSTIGKGEIVSMDTTAAARVPGVRHVMTPWNAPKLKSSKAPGQQGRVLSVLQDTKVYYHNQPIALVLADSFEAAWQAADRVKVRYREEAPVMHSATYQPDKLIRDPADSARGDADTAFLGAAKKMRATYRSPVEVHNPMEPHGTLAAWENGKLTVYDATQGVFGVRSVLSGMLQIPKEDVRVISHFLGGGFGCKGSPWSHVVLAAMAARQMNRPVRLLLRRPQMFGMVGYRPHNEQTISLGADASGRLVAMRNDLVTQTSTFDEYVDQSVVVTRQLYSCPNVTTTTRVMRINQGTPTFMRAPGYSTGTYALETAMDELAWELGIDPLQLRLINYAERDEDKKLPWSSKSLRECYQVAAQRFGWDRRNPRPNSMNGTGMGMATAFYPAHRMPSSAMARINRDGTAYVEAGTQDIGTGTYTIMTQIAADGLGLPVSQVRFELGDTVMPDAPLSAGSMTAASVGPAVHDAARAVRRQIIEMAIADAQSPLHGVAYDDVQVQDGVMIAGSRREAYRDLLARHDLAKVQATVDAKPGEEAEKFSMQGFGAVFAQVHVDAELGEVRVERIAAAYGIGRRLNEKTARSQLIGGIVWGIGMALTEEAHIDPRTARMVNNDLAEYHVPVNADVPHIDVSFIDEVDPHINSLGAKGCGEIGITGVAAAIGNAIYHACGRRVRDLPFTLDKVMRA